jgi:hypothetical protein
MKQIIAACVLLAASQLQASDFAPCPACGAGPLHAPPAYLLPQPVHGGQGWRAPSQTYAYGWFGATRATCRKTVSHGYYNTYKQWSFR